MRSFRTKITLFCLLFLLASPTSADEARAILDKAIQAHGGAEKLARTKRGRIIAKAEGKFGTSVREEVWEETFDLPRRYRKNVQGTRDGKPYSQEMAVVGTSGWFREDQLPPRSVPFLAPTPLEEHWHTMLAQLLLLRGKDADLKFRGEQMKGGRRLAIVSASSSRATADLYFDRSTGLLARAMRPLSNPMAGNEGPEQIGRNNYDEYKEIQGVQYPMHIRVTNPNATVDIKIDSVEFLDKIDDAVFVKPVVEGAPEEPATPEESATPPAETPARWDTRLIVATLIMGAVVAAVWFFVRGSKSRKQETPPQ